MKKTYFLFTLLLSAGMLKGQITLNSGNVIPYIGTTLNYDVDNKGNVDIGSVGSAKTWDWSSFSGKGETFKHIGPTSHSEGSNFSSANRAEEFSSGANFYKLTNSEFSLIGHYIKNVARVTYTTPRVLFTFPTKMGTKHTKSFKATVQNLAVGQSFTRTGSITSHADAEGKLILPHETHNNVIRVLTVSTYKDEFGGTTIANYVDTVIYWYNGVSMQYLASYTSNYTNGIKAIQSASILAKGSSLHDYSSEMDFNVYPNPTKGELFISDLNRNDIIELYSLTGKKILEMNVSGEEDVVEIPVYGLEPSIYLLKVSNNNSQKTTRVVVN